MSSRVGGSRVWNYAVECGRVLSKKFCKTVKMNENDAIYSDDVEYEESKI